MRKIDVINKAIEDYQGIDGNRFKNVFDERSLLSPLRIELEWQVLSAPEKQQKRKLLFLRMKKMETPIEQLNEIFALEICIIEFYDSLQDALNKLELMDRNKVSVTRLSAMLFVEKILINEFYDVKKIRHHNFKILSDLLVEYSNEPEFTQLDLQALSRKLSEKEELLNNIIVR